MSAIEELRETMARLRAPGGCPWDIEQTHQSLCDNLIEEAAELLETIDRGDFDHMREELGDVLLQVVFHSQMAAEAGHFNFDDVAAEINEKLVRRHPHVFGDMDLEDSQAVLKEWEAIKAKEKKNGPKQMGVLKDLPQSLNAILTAREILKQIAKKSLQSSYVEEKIIEEKSEQLTEEKVGEELFNWIGAARVAGIDPESALRRYCLKVSDEIEAQKRRA